MPRIILATCAKYPRLSASNSAYADALRSKGCDVQTPAWNEAPIEAFLDSDLILLRQTWDYQDDPGGFAAWVARVSSLKGNIENPPELVIWNNDKRTLNEVTQSGVPVPPTCGLMPEAPAEMFSRLDSEKIVLKPAFGGSGTGVRLCSEADFEGQLCDARREAPGRPFLAQAFLPEIAAGEWKITCIGGRVAFAVHAKPKPGEFRINSRFDPTIRVLQPPLGAVRAAEDILAWIRRPLICCRIDGVMRGEDFICTELELTDPDLHLDLFDTGAGLLAQATLDHLASG
ncbi:ATP-grasp domain-containing protein [Denitrobaculum tricleocarpae]|uniref:Prokaryotic glutathione synthetase ATP-binding domain-containing protein n=1 Tax=Denitrobaculum tricleocarpae TaxID=2591009 RepID=A0A545U2Q5_9PROT|nr:hypothetical protein [Denitrobaculum tricleocarpae]TQV83751.1 hypothetical protein FKG95_03995 [Denitrobaculum tricleocarpae]